jgi:hypothetical protein
MCPKGSAVDPLPRYITGEGMAAARAINKGKSKAIVGDEDTGKGHGKAGYKGKGEALVGEGDNGKGHGTAGDKGKGGAIVGEEDKGKGAGKAGDKGNGETIVGEEGKGTGKTKAVEGKGKAVAQRNAEAVRSGATRSGEICRLYLLEDASPRTPSSSSS